MPSDAIPEVTRVNVDDPTDVALWALVMKTDPRDVADVARKVGSNPEVILDFLKNPQ